MYWDCQGELGRELGLAPWQWPPIISPDWRELERAA